jgi:uncharacterized integral membrane protein
MRLLTWIVMLPLAIVIIAFSVANRQTMTLDLWPLPLNADVPVFMVVLAGLLLGFLWGGLVMWLSGGKARRNARLGVQRARKAERELSILRDKAMDQDPQPQQNPSVPAGNTLPATVPADAA